MRRRRWWWLGVIAIILALCLALTPRDSDSLAYLYQRLHVVRDVFEPWGNETRRVIYFSDPASVVGNKVASAAIVEPSSTDLGMWSSDEFLLDNGQRAFLAGPA